MSTRDLQALLERFTAAWNAHDIDALMECMSDDCVFSSSAGPDAVGTRFTGSEAVRTAYEDMWKTFPDAHWGDASHFISGDRGVSEWLFTGTMGDGTRVETHGCDLLTFADGRIQTKDSYRKNRQSR